MERGGLTKKKYCRTRCILSNGPKGIIYRKCMKKCLKLQRFN